MSPPGKAFGALAFLAIVVLVVGGYAIWSAVDEKTKNRRACEAIHAKPVSTGRGHYLCLAPDGRVVAP